MHTDQIIKQLNNLKAISPSPTFKEKSRGLILKIPPKTNYIEWRTLSLAGITAVILLILVVGSNLSQPIISSLDEDRLNKELGNLNINIQLREISYQQKINQTIASALNEISDNDVRHLNQSLLETEQNDINLDDSANPEIDNLLNQIIF